MRHLLHALVLAATLPITVGCDTNGYASFGDPLDVIVPCGEVTTAWLRSTCGPDAQGTLEESLITELITLGASTLDPTLESAGCFNFTRFHYDASSKLRVGNFSTSGDQMEVRFGDLYTFTLEKDLTLLKRHGSDRNPLEPPEAHSYAFSVSPDGATLTLTDNADGSVREYQNLTRIIEGLDLEVEADAFAFTGIAAIPLYQAFTRLIGYGAAGMTQYMDSPATFAAASTGELGVVVTGGITAPHTTLSFRQFEEFAGFELDGEFDSLVTIQGNGQTCGGLNFTTPNSLADATSVYTGYLDFTDIDVTEGYAGEGCMQISVDDFNGAPLMRWVPSQVFNTIDLSEILPTDGRMPGDPAPACRDHVPWVNTTCPRPGAEACTIPGY